MKNIPSIYVSMLLLNRFQENQQYPEVVEES